MDSSKVQVHPRYLEGALRCPDFLWGGTFLNLIAVGASWVGEGPAAFQTFSNSYIIKWIMNGKIEHLAARRIVSMPCQV